MIDKTFLMFIIKHLPAFAKFLRERTSPPNVTKYLLCKFDLFYYKFQIGIAIKTFKNRF